MNLLIDLFQPGPLRTWDIDGGILLPPLYDFGPGASSLFRESGRRTRRGAVRHEGPSKPSVFLDPSSVAEFLGVSRRWVMEHTRTGDLPALRFGKVFRYKMSAIEAWLEGQHAKR